ncbi:GNAT family N-acetyltransferase [Gracilibacillus kekensis]|uniref:Acetyltransferase (GNAT) domain-containing protein n=1 Tax=Gracilibacillus kekensis TaxID=1027249 RepID=A0A1M7J3N0_9BACI|nr:GNAT family N-acetyltransferase [Gracilibacillus kekensis]SHM47605.1 Acetyltransferase (GNAT) domain-containing protein [Gracilibacillus kekensis]
MEVYKDEFLISDDRTLINIQTVYNLLSPTYWAKDRSIKTIEKSIENSYVFGVYHNNNQIGFGRIVSDQAVFSWILDVVINSNYQGKGIGTWLIECMIQHPDLINTKFALATKDAHDFYRKFNFKEKDCMIKK